MFIPADLLLGWVPRLMKASEVADWERGVLTSKAAWLHHTGFHRRVRLPPTIVLWKCHHTETHLMATFRWRPHEHGENRAFAKNQEVLFCVLAFRSHDNSVLKMHVGVTGDFWKRNPLSWWKPSFVKTMTRLQLHPHFILHEASGWAAPSKASTTPSVAMNIKCISYCQTQSSANLIRFYEDVIDWKHHRTKPVFGVCLM